MHNGQCRDRTMAGTSIPSNECIVKRSIRTEGIPCVVSGRDYESMRAPLLSVCTVAYRSRSIPRRSRRSSPNQLRRAGLPRTGGSESGVHQLRPAFLFAERRGQPQRFGCGFWVAPRSNDLFEERSLLPFGHAVWLGYRRPVTF